MKVALTGATGFRGIADASTGPSVVEAAHRTSLGNGVYSAVAELTEAAAASVGAPGAVPGSDTEARGRLGDDFAEVLLLDQGTTAAKARSDLGWTPSRPTLVDEFLQGSYRR
jgi:hypothetical protein